MAIRIAEHWFERRAVDDDVTLLWEPHVDPLIRCNIWHVRGRDRDLLVDTGLGIASLREAARDLFEKPLVTVVTHTHYDHVGGLHEFDTRVMHRAEADGATGAALKGTLRAADMPDDFRAYLDKVGYGVAEELVTAYPAPDFDPAAYEVRAAAPTWVVDEGDVIDLGDRAFEVLHLPGHSPGSIGLWEAGSGTLFSGDAIYDGPLLDELTGSDVGEYIHTMQRLRALPVAVVHAGHDPSFGRERLIEIADDYLRSRKAAWSPPG